MSLVFDYCCARPAAAEYERWRAELMHVRSSLIQDLEYVRRHRTVMRKRPEKGVTRIVMAAGWLVLHLYALIVLSLYGAFPHGPVHAVWWFWTTGLAGIMYVLLMYSDPGFVDRETLLRLTSHLNLGVDVVGSDAGRGLLTDVEGRLPSMTEMLPLDAQPLPPAEDDADEKRDAKTMPAGAPLDNATSDSSKLTQMSGANHDGIGKEDEGNGEQQTRPSTAGTSIAEVRVHIQDDARPGRKSAAKARARIGPTDSRSAESDIDTPAGGPPSSSNANGLPDTFGDPDSDDDIEAAELRRRLATNPRMVGVDEEGAVEAAQERAREAAERRKQPPGVFDYFSGYCDEADMYLPIRAKYCKKHGRIVAKFDHYCYVLENSVGELNHGRFYRCVLMQVISIWTGVWLCNESFITFHNTMLWTASNTPLIIMNIISWMVGLPLTILLCIHTFMMLTSSTTYEFIKLEKLEYMNGFYQYSFPFSQGLCFNIKHFCCPSGLQLWPRAPPEEEWPETFWRNRYYSCCG